MPKIIEIKPEPKKEIKAEDEIKESEEETEPELDEALDESENSLLAIADSPNTGWESVIDQDASPTLDRKIIRSTGFSLGSNLESSLEDVPLENVDENKPVENYKNDSSSYMGKGGVLGQMAETKRMDEITNEGPFRTVNNWKPEFEDPNAPKAYEVKRSAEDTLGDVNGVAFQKYTPRR